MTILVIGEKSTKKIFERLQVDNDNVQVTPIPVTYYTPAQVSALTSGSGFLELPQCYYSSASLEYAVLIIMTPNDLSLNPFQKNYVIVEVSTVKDVWNDSTVLGTNYYFDENEGLITMLYNNITWKNPPQDQTVFIRYLAYNGVIPASMQLSYTNDADISPGIYNQHAFKNNGHEIGKYEAFKQVIKSSSVINVPTLNYTYFSVQFCSNVYPFDHPSSYINVAVNTIAQPLSLFSATTVSVCSKSQVLSADLCTTSSAYAISNQCACSVNVLSKSYGNSNYNELEAGLFVSVFGEGSPSDGINQVTVTLTID